MDCLRGLDVSLEATRVCVVNGEDKVIRKRILPFDPDVIDLSWLKYRIVSALC